MAMTEAEPKNKTIDQQEDCWSTVLWYAVQCLCSAESEDAGKGD